MDDEKRKTILAFAKQVGESGLDPMETARARDWLDDDGSVTEEGEKLLEALEDQKTTRTVFRGNF